MRVKGEKLILLLLLQRKKENNIYGAFTKYQVFLGLLKYIISSNS